MYENGSKIALNIIQIAVLKDSRKVAYLTLHLSYFDASEVAESF